MAACDYRATQQGSSVGTSASPPPGLSAALSAAEQSDWQAVGRLIDVLDLDESPAGLELLATVRYRDGVLEDTLSAWERLHALHVRRGENLEAARAGAMMATHLLMDSGLLAAVRGWLARTERLLIGFDETPVHALVAMVHGYERFMAGDLELAKSWASRAVVIGERHDVVPAQILGRMARARVTIIEGDVDAGLAELEKLADILLAGDVEPLTTGIMVCELICAMQGLAQYDRAEQWTTAYEQMRSQGELFGAVIGRCRVHHAEILRLRGSCEEAERVALQACEELRPWLRREFGWPLTELGNIRLRRGDLAGAEEAFTAAHANGWDPEPGFARVRLAQGDVAGAFSLITDALERPLRIPSKERPPMGRLTRAPLLEAYVEIALAADELDAARVAADELSEIAATYRSVALRAAADLAHGRVLLATGQASDAVGRCRMAVDVWCEVGAPYEAAVARHVLAEALAADGHGDLAAVEHQAVDVALASIRAVPPDGGQTTAGADATSGLTPVTIDDEPAVDTRVFQRDGDTRTLSFQGQTVRLRDLVGMRYLERLLAAPGREFHVLDLVAAVQGLSADGSANTAAEGVRANEDTGPLLDDEARRAYQRRLAEIEEDLEDAERRGDGERAALAAADREFIIDELSRAFGLGGRSRPGTSTSERARSSVTRSVRYALGRIAEHHQPLAHHLQRTIRIGVYCSYEPDPSIAIRWQT